MIYLTKKVKYIFEIVFYDDARIKSSFHSISKNKKVNLFLDF